jgi:hypothetical protein
MVVHIVVRKPGYFRNEDADDRIVTLKARVMALTKRLDLAQLRRWQRLEFEEPQQRRVERQRERGEREREMDEKGRSRVRNTLLESSARFAGIDLSARLLNYSSGELLCYHASIFAATHTVIISSSWHH